MPTDCDLFSDLSDFIYSSTIIVDEGLAMDYNQNITITIYDAVTKYGTDAYGHMHNLIIVTLYVSFEYCIGVNNLHFIISKIT